MLKKFAKKNDNPIRDNLSKKLIYLNLLNKKKNLSISKKRILRNENNLIYKKVKHTIIVENSNKTPILF